MVSYGVDDRLVPKTNANADIDDDLREGEHAVASARQIAIAELVHFHMEAFELLAFKISMQKVKNYFQNILISDKLGISSIFLRRNCCYINLKV